MPLRLAAWQAVLGYADAPLHHPGRDACRPCPFSVTLDCNGSEVQRRLSVLQVLTVMLVAVAMALALAHAFEFPGKMRLDRETYDAMQPIYYPGFTIGGGIGEAGGTIATLILLFLTPLGSADFWLTLVAFLGLIGMPAVYWLLTHPINQFWVAGVNLDRFSSGFLSWLLRCVSLARIYAVFRIYFHATY